MAQFASDKKAEDVIVLDMRKVVNFCDYFVICSGNVDRHVKAIAEGIDEGLEQLGISLPGFGRKAKTTEWIVLDAGDVITHIFQKDLREFYNLEYLWQQAKKVKLGKEVLSK
ncbi:MAG: ribosome silencing factor [Candidatus Omnitrophica bacterium]|nr:ribosome silencing factor [Candidatus Omnitrophota bacterium]